MRASELVLDFTLYPRHKVDDRNLDRIRLSLEAGEKMPPVRADKESHRVI